MCRYNRLAIHSQFILMWTGLGHALVHLRHGFLRAPVMWFELGKWSGVGETCANEDDFISAATYMRYLHLDRAPACLFRGSCLALPWPYFRFWWAAKSSCLSPTSSKFCSAECLCNLRFEPFVHSFGDPRLMQTHARFAVQAKDVAQHCLRSDESKIGIVHASKTVELRTGLD